MDVSVITDNLRYMGGGLLLTFEIAVMAVTGGLLWGIVLGLGRLSPIRLIYYPASIYIHFFRGIPLILVIFWIYFLLPVFLGPTLGKAARRGPSRIILAENRPILPKLAGGGIPGGPLLGQKKAGPCKRGLPPRGGWTFKREILPRGP